MNIRQKASYYIRALFIMAICLFGISIFFISSSFLETLLARSLKLRITPSYTGGEVAQDFFDSSSDDTGSGILCYPSNANFAQGSLDIIRYTVHKPVFGAQWQQSPEYWQLDIEYKSGPAAVKNILIYIDIDGADSGSTETLVPEAENVAFDKSYPWDFAVQFCNGVGQVFDADRHFICKTESSILKDGAVILIRIPLQDKRLQKIYTAETTHHYVLSGGFSEWDNGNFMQIEEQCAVSHGGVKNGSEFNALIPKIYDMLDDTADDSHSQIAQLSSWNASSYSKAVIYPISVSMKHADSQPESETFIKEVETAYYKFQEVQNAADKDTYTSADKNPTTPDAILNLAICAFNAGLNQEAETLLAQVLGIQPDNAQALAYYGSCIATKADTASVMQAVTLVNDAYKYLDDAASRAAGTTVEFDVLLNRAFVSKSVPNAVFGKAIIGAEDFTKCAMLYKKTADMTNLTMENRTTLAYLYICAADCYKTAGKDTESIMSIKEAEKLWN